MFFTFWGLNMLRKASAPPVQKTIVEKMFGWMMPQGSKKLPLSTMQMMGIGPKMIRAVMKSKNIASLEELMDSAKRQGVEIVACQMSMDVMGIKREELIDGIRLASTHRNSYKRWMTARIEAGRTSSQSVSRVSQEQAGIGQATAPVLRFGFSQYMLYTLPGIALECPSLPQTP
ncbi:hypothetical protein D3C84_770710 [compost metagenome]